MSDENDYRGRWVRALRGDDFIQGVGYLAFSDGDSPLAHCCLGVAAEIFHEDMNILKKVDSTGITHFGGKTAYLPDELAKALNLSQNHQSELVMMNDNGVRFDTIAAWIEENVPEEDTDSEEEDNEEDEYSRD